MRTVTSGFGCGFGFGAPATAIPGSEMVARGRFGSSIRSVRASGSTVVRVATKTTAAGATSSGTRAKRTRPH
jgi:hypothetical protein